MTDYQIKNHFTKVISVMIISRDIFVAQGLFSCLKNSVNFSVVDRLYSDDPHIHTILKQEPDILLMHAPDINPKLTDICQQLDFLHSPTKCIFLLVSDDHKQYLTAVKAGAKGVLSYKILFMLSITYTLANFLLLQLLPTILLRNLANWIQKTQRK